MAEKKYIKDVQKEKGKFGTFKTATGGGEPIPAGHKRTNEKRDPDQPRDAEGHFTYNAVNGKPLKEISKSHGHSRGTTIPPTLTGGDGTIHYYSDSSHKNVLEGATQKVAELTGLDIESIYRKGAGLVGFNGQIKVAKKDFIESATEYVANKGDIEKLSGSLKEAAEARANNDKEALKAATDKILAAGHFAGDPTGSWESHEANTDEEKRAVEKAKAEGTMGRELVEREPEKEVPAEPKEEKKPTTGGVAPGAGRTKTEKSLELGSTSSSPSTKDTFSSEQISRISKLIPGVKNSEDVEEMIEQGKITQEQIDDMLKPKISPEKEKEARQKADTYRKAIRRDSAFKQKLVDYAKKNFPDDIPSGWEDMAIASFAIDKLLEKALYGGK